MIIKKKRKLAGKQLLIVIAAAILALLIAAYAIISAVIGAIDASDEGDSDLPEIIEGESIFGAYAIAYPYVSETSIQNLEVEYLNVDKEKNKFSMYRTTQGSDFRFKYTNTDGNFVDYAPAITTEDKNFEYSDLYAKETANDYSFYKLTYLASAIGALTFKERIELASDESEKALQLKRYGLGEDGLDIKLEYLDENKEKQVHNVTIGDKTLDGSGYYFTVDGRNYIYTSRSNDLEYATNGFLSFIHSRIVAEGLSEDSTFEPYLTNDYKQWKNTQVWDNKNGEIEGFEIIPSGADVIVNGTSLTPFYGTEAIKVGFAKSDKTQFTFHLAEENSENIINAIVGKSLSYDKPIVVTDLVDSNWASIGREYTYTISRIDSAFTSGADITDEGTPVGDNRYVKVMYTYTVRDGGVTAHYDKPTYAVIDLEESNTGMPEEAKNALRSGVIGDLSEPIEFSVTYTLENCSSYNLEYRIDEIAVIYTEDENGRIKIADTVSENSIVAYRYTLLADGEELESDSAVLYLSDVKEEETENYQIKTALIGKGRGAYENLTGYKATLSRQYMIDFISYEIESFEYYVTSELIVSFGFINADKRDPFYGESLFENTLTNEYQTYALDATACEMVVRLLGGVNDDSSSTMSVGLVGSETVAIGLSPENMNKFGLYANTIYFELPRGIEEVDTTEDGASIYDHIDTLGVHLYISNASADGTRYIGSDLYDIIVKIDADGFGFLDKSFVEYWARKSLAAVSYENISEMTFEFYMSNLSGRYDLNMLHKTVWIYDNKLYSVKPENGGQAYDLMDMEIAAVGSGHTESAFTSLLLETEKRSAKLTELYDYVGGVSRDNYDYPGTSQFKSLLSMIYGTYYVGSLTAEERAAAFESATKVMSFSFTVDGSAAYPYVYDFYRIDGSRVMVSLYQDSGSGKVNHVSDFYISNQGFKKIANGFMSLLNGGVVNEDIGY